METSFACCESEWKKWSLKLLTAILPCPIYRFIAEICFFFVMHAYVKYFNRNERHANPFARMFKIFCVERTGVNLEVISSRTHKANLCIQRNIKLISFAWNAQAHIHTYTDTDTLTRVWTTKASERNSTRVLCRSVGHRATLLLWVKLFPVGLFCEDDAVWCF